MFKFYRLLSLITICVVLFLPGAVSGGSMFSDIKKNMTLKKEQANPVLQDARSSRFQNKTKETAKISVTPKTSSKGAEQSATLNFSGGSIVALLDKASNNYCSARSEKNYALLADATVVGPLERFTVISKGGSKVAFQADNGNYLAVDTLDPAAPLKSSLANLDTYGTYDVGRSDGEAVFIRACNGKYLTVVKGRVCASSNEPVALICKIQPVPATIPFPTFRSKGGLKCGYQRDNQSVLGSGKTIDNVTFCRPNLPNGWVFVGDTIAIGTDMTQAPALVLEDVPSSDLLRRPQKLVCFKSVSSSDKTPFSLWLPVPEPGYVAMGLIAATSNKEPTEILAKLRCIKADQVKPGRVSQPFWRSTSVQLTGFAITRATDDTDGIVPGTFAIARYNQGLIGVSGGQPFEAIAPDADGYISGLSVRCDTHRVVAIKPFFGRLSNRSEQKEGPRIAPCKADDKMAIEKQTVMGKDGGLVGWCCQWGPGFIIDLGSVMGKFTATDNLFNRVNESNPYTRRTAAPGVTNSMGFESSDVMFRGIVGRADDKGFHSIGFLPIPAPQAWVLKGMTPDDIHKDIFEGVRDSLVQDQQAKIEEYSLSQLCKKYPKVAEGAKTDRPVSEADARADMMDSIRADVSTAQTLKPKTEEKMFADQLVEGPSPMPSVAIPALKPATTSEFSSSFKAWKDLPDDQKLEKFPGFENLGCVKGVVLTNAKVLEGDSWWFGLSGHATITLAEFGAVEGEVVALARQDKNEGIRASLAVFTSADEIKGKVGIFESEPLNTMIFTGAAVACAPEAHGWQFDDLPAPVKDIWTEKTGVETGEIRFNEKPTAIFGMPFKKIPVLSDILKMYLTDVKTALAYAIPATRDGDINTCRVDFDTSYRIENLMPGLKLTNPGLELHLGGIALLGNMQLRLSSSIEFTLPVRLDVPFSKETCLKQGINLTAMIPGEWKNPMGIPGLTLKEMMVAGGLGGSSPYLGLKGTFDYGKKLELAGAISPTAPMGIAALSARTPEWTLNDIIIFQTFLQRAALAQAKVETPQPDLPLDFIKLKDVSIMISQVTNPALGLYKGIIASGQLDIGGETLGTIQSHIYPSTGVFAYAMIRNIDLGPISLTGSGPDEKLGTADDCPVFMLQYEVSPNLSGILKQKCFINGAVDICGAYLDYTQEFQKQNMKVSMVGKFGNVLGVGIEGRSDLADVFSLGGLKLKGWVQGLYLNEVQNKVMDAVKSIPYLDVIIGALQHGIFRLDAISFLGSFTEIAKGKLPGLEVDCAIIGQDVTIPIPGIDVTRTPDVMSAIVDFLGNKVTDQVGDLAGYFASIFKDTAAKIAKDVAGKATEAANKVKNVAIDTGNVVAKTANQVADFSRTSADTLEKGAESALAACQDVALDLLDGAEKVIDAIEDAWHSIFG